jgi:hypothetical protein
MPTMIRLLAFAALLTIASGCSSPLSPKQVEGAYTLQTVDGAHLPAVLYAQGTDTLYIFQGRLQLNANRTGTRYQYLVFRRPGVPQQITEMHLDVTYRIRGTVVEISTTCPANALCTEPPHDRARLTGDALVVEQFDGRTAVYTTAHTQFQARAGAR